MTADLFATSSLFPLYLVTRSDGSEAETPEAFEGRSNVVLMALSPDHLAVTATWLPWIEAVTARRPGLRAYQLWSVRAETERVEWARRSESEEGGHVGSPAEILFHVGDPAKLQSALNLHDTDAPWILSVSVDGLVHHRECGAFTHEAADRLLDALLSGA